MWKTLPGQAFLLLLFLKSIRGMLEDNKALMKGNLSGKEAFAQRHLALQQPYRK